MDDPAAGGEWRVEAAPRAADGGLAPAPYLPPVGVGDEIHYNGDRWQPIAAPGRHAMPLTVDWDGDGLVDVLCASHHANGLGMPWGGVFFWRNIGSNREPRFAPPMRLYADGVNLVQREYRMYDIPPQREFISEDYLCCDVFDWFGSGRPDLITISQRGGIKVYRNTGARDAAGLPALELAATVPFPPLLAAGRYLQLKVRDWDGSGRPSLIIGSVSHDKQTHVAREQIVLLRNTGRDPATGDWAFSPMVLPISGARIGHDVRIADPEFSNFSNHRALSIDVFDIDGDGMLELLCCHVLDLRSPIVELWRNVGSVDEPAMMNQGQLPWSRDAMAFGFHFARNAAFQGCIRASWYDDYGFRYFEQVGPTRSPRTASAMPAPCSARRARSSTRGWSRATRSTPAATAPSTWCAATSPATSRWCATPAPPRRPPSRRPSRSATPPASRSGSTGRASCTTTTRSGTAASSSPSCVTGTATAGWTSSSATTPTGSSGSRATTRAATASPRGASWRCAA